VIANCDQFILLVWLQLEQEVRRELGAIPTDLLVQSMGLHAIEFCKISIQDDPASPDHEDFRLDGTGRIVVQGDAHAVLFAASSMHRRHEARCFQSHAEVDQRDQAPSTIQTSNAGMWISWSLTFVSAALMGGRRPMAQAGLPPLITGYSFDEMGIELAEVTS
jgi:hypothetical protein